MTIDFGLVQHYEVGQGFPSIEGWHLDAHLELSFWDSFLHFQRGNKETRQLERLHVILHEGRLRSADVDLRPLYAPTQIAFPRVISGDFAEETDRGGKKLMGGLLRFESGSLGISFLRVFHIRRSLQLGPPPELHPRFIDAMAKDEERTGQPQQGEPPPVAPLNYQGWSIVGLGISASDLLSFTLMAFGAVPKTGRIGKS